MDTCFIHVSLSLGKTTTNHGVIELCQATAAVPWDSKLGVGLLFSRPYAKHVTNLSNSRNSVGIVKIDLVYVEVAPQHHNSRAKLAVRRNIFFVCVPNSLSGAISSLCASRTSLRHAPRPQAPSCSTRTPGAPVWWQTPRQSGKMERAYVWHGLVDRAGASLR